MYGSKYKGQSLRKKKTSTIRHCIPTHRVIAKEFHERERKKMIYGCNLFENYLLSL